MDISKLPPPSSAPAAGTPASTGDRTARTPVAADVPAGTPDIRPLDLASALKILISEVGLSLNETLLRPPDFNDPPPPWPASAEAAARALVELVLRLVPPGEMPAEALQQSVDRLRAAMDAGAQNAIQRATDWRGTPPNIPDALRQSQGLARVVLSDDVPAGVLIRPEWLGLQPKITQLRRRLKLRRLLLTEVDADHVEPDLKRDTEDGGG